MAELTGKNLQRFFSVLVRKQEGTEREPGYVTWFYRLACRNCHCKSKEEETIRKGIPASLFDWARKHHKCKKKGKKKPRPG